MRSPRAPAVLTIAAGCGLLGFSLGGVNAVDADVAAAERAAAVERVRVVDVVREARPCPFERRHRVERSLRGAEL